MWEVLSSVIWFQVVPRGGLEPPRSNEHTVLSRICLPIPASGLRARRAGLPVPCLRKQALLAQQFLRGKYSFGIPPPRLSNLLYTFLS